MVNRVFVRIAVSGLLIALSLGCSAKTKYEILTFFFTGVPPFEEEIGQHEGTDVQSANTVERTPPPKPTLVFHKPYADKQCQKCHKTRGMFGRFSQKAVSISLSPMGDSPGILVVPLKELCVRCHANISLVQTMEEKLWLHAPVATGKCTICHNPHQAPFPSLLIKAPQELCSGCHSEGLILKNAVEHNEKKTCLECHNPHLGKNRLMLAKDYKEVMVPPVDPLTNPVTTQAQDRAASAESPAPQGEDKPSPEGGSSQEDKMRMPWQ